MMGEYHLGVIEMRFAELIWKNEPLTSGELVKLCAKDLSWKKSTTYTVLRKLCDRGLFRNQNGMVTSAITREELRSIQSQSFLDENFSGSLPLFLATFTTRRKLTEEEIQELQHMIDNQRG